MEKHPSLANHYSLPAPEPLLSMRVIRESEDLDLKHGSCDAELLPLSARGRLKGALRFTTKSASFVERGMPW